MSGAAPTRPWTYEEYARLPDDGNRYEVLDGVVLVTPAPGTRHQRTARTLFLQLHAYVEQHGIGEMMWDIDLLFVDGNYLRPDMLFVPNAERHRLVERGMEGVPSLVVEIVSTGSARIDRIDKPRRYGEFGVPEYWAVDSGRRAIMVWDYERGAAVPRIENERVLWQPETVAPALEIAVPPLFD